MSNETQPEEDRPRLTREELDALTIAAENRGRITLVGSVARKLLALAQRTVAAEADVSQMTIENAKLCALADEQKTRAEQAEAKLAAAVARAYEQGFADFRSWIAEGQR